MRVATLTKLTTWLCLVATVFLGISPGQAWVLCLEPNGAVSFEPASDANRCEGCPEDASDSSEGAVAATDASACPCIDIPFVLEGEQDKVELKRIDLPVSKVGTVPDATVLIFAPVATASQARPDTPRPARSLAMIRSVVLLV